MKKLQISSELALPPDAASLTSAILGIRGSGKTHTAKVIAEELLEAGQQIVVVDPLDAWWGLKSSADGKSPGYPVVILGGQHGDLPVKATDGETVADFLVEHRAPCVLSLRHMSKADQRRFVTAFCERLYHRKGEPGRSTPLPVFVDEASSFVPQRVSGDVARMVGAIEDMVRRGRQSGLGVFLIDQRAASVNKDVLTQIEVLVCHRTTSPQDRKALMEWVQAHDTEGRADDFLASLASLGRGEAWVWSPGFLDLFLRTQVRPLRTYDSSATPKAGARQAAPAKLADVDLDVLREQLAATVEEAKASDPREWKKEKSELLQQVAQLERKNESLSAQLAQAEEHAREVKSAAPMMVPAFTDEDWRRLNEYREALARVAADLITGEHNIKEKLDAVIAAQSAARAPKVAGPTQQPAQARASTPSSPSTPVKLRHAPSQNERKSAPAAVGDLVVSNSQQRVLDAIAFFESIGNPAPTNLQVGAVALMDATGGHFSNVVGPLSSAGLILRGDGRMRLTDVGRSLANVPDRVATLDEYHDVLRARVLKARAASRRTVDILDVVISRGGDPVTNEEIGKEVGIDHTGGHYSNTIGPLSTLGLITRRDGKVHPTEILFPEGLR